MKVAKDYIKQTLISTGFHDKNIFDFEQLDNNQLFKNLDSAEFFGGRGTVKKSVRGQSIELNSAEDNYISQKQVLERSFAQSLRLVMKKETLEDRLTKFYGSLYTENSPTGAIARLEAILQIDEKDNTTGQVTQTSVPVYYDILDNVTSQIGKERPGSGAVEVILTFQIKTGVIQREKTITIDDFPVSTTIIE